MPFPKNSLFVPKRPISTAGYLRRFFSDKSVFSKNRSLESLLNLFVIPVGGINLVHT